MAVNGTTLAVGQIWLAYNGERVEILKNDGHLTHPWVSGMQSYSDVGEVYGPRRDMSLSTLVFPLPALAAQATPPVRTERLSDKVATMLTAEMPKHSILARQVIDMDHPDYCSLANVLQMAYNQAATGKGAERHANNLPFHLQPMTTINLALGSIDGFIYQAHKKSLEAKRLPSVDRQVAELLGAINYLAGAVIALSTARDAK